MPTNWTHDLQLTFIETYQCFPIIWDPKHEDHKDRNKLNDAWNAISEVLKIPVKELKHKKDSLMATFRMHKRKIKLSERSGAGTKYVYTPIWFAFNLMNSFLGDIFEGNSHKIKDKVAYTRETDYSQDDELLEQIIEPKTNATGVSELSNTPQTIRRRKDPPEPRDAGKTINRALNTLDEVLRNRRSSQQPEDDCDLYARMLANKLRRLPEDERMSFMYEIDGMFLRRLSRNTALPHVTVSPLSPHHVTVSPLSPHHVSRPSSSHTSDSEPTPALP